MLITLKLGELDGIWQVIKFISFAIPAILLNPKFLEGDYEWIKLTIKENLEFKSIF